MYRYSQYPRVIQITNSIISLTLTKKLLILGTLNILKHWNKFLFKYCSTSIRKPRNSIWDFSKYVLLFYRWLSVQSRRSIKKKKLDERFFYLLRYLSFLIRRNRKNFNFYNFNLQKVEQERWQSGIQIILIILNIQIFINYYSVKNFFNTIWLSINLKKLLFSMNSHFIKASGSSIKPMIEYYTKMKI